MKGGNALLFGGLAAFLLFSMTKASAKDTEVIGDAPTDPGFKPSTDDSPPEDTGPQVTARQSAETNSWGDDMSADELLSSVCSYIKLKEGLRLYVYDDANGKPWAQSQAGNPTIGYGHLLDRKTDDLSMTLDQAGADALLREDVAARLNPLIDAVKVPLSIDAWAAITSLAFNVGLNGVLKSKFLAALNAGDMEAANVAFHTGWNTAKVNGVSTVIPGLVKRRAEEWAMITNGEEPVNIV